MVEEAVCRVAEMSRVGQQRELSVEKDHGVAILQEVLCGSRPPCSCAEVVDKPHRVVLQRHRGPARSNEHNLPLQVVVVVDEARHVIADL